MTDSQITKRMLSLIKRKRTKSKRVLSHETELFDAFLKKGTKSSFRRWKKSILIK